MGCRVDRAVFPLWVMSIFVLAAGHLPGADPYPREIVEQFDRQVLPFLKSYCYQCHGPDLQEGKLDLSGDTSIATILQREATWGVVIERLAAGEMPPRSSDAQPSTTAREAVINWVTALRDLEAERHAGDPGGVLARRLNNVEFDNTIRDLTGVDIHPAREFPVDPANEEGFDNSGESLGMSPALARKYYDAARSVADHVVLTTQDLAFAPHPAITETDRDKYCVRRIVDFYQTHAVDIADYFEAAWRYDHRQELGLDARSLAEIANDSRHSPYSGHGPGTRGLSPKYLELVWQALHEAHSIGPFVEIQAEWMKIANDSSLIIPAKNGEPQRVDDLALRAACERLRNRTIEVRDSLEAKVEKLHVKGNSDGSQPLILWWNRQIATQRMRYRGDGKDETLDAERTKFCRVFPAGFAVTSRGHYADKNLGADVRLLTAGFHLMQGYFRDDEPLYELVLSESEKRELDTLWDDLKFVTLVPFRQYKDFLFFERAETPRFSGGEDFDFARPEDKDITSEAKLTRVRDLYLDITQRSDASAEAMRAFEDYFQSMSADFRWIERMQVDTVPLHLASLLRFAARAYRRELTGGEQTELVTFYARLRSEDGLSHEDAIRDSIVSFLMSPYFCYRYDLAEPGDAIRPLSNDELASRLSYFLWSSMPDERLRRSAQEGSLQDSQQLAAEAKRMLGDPRTRSLSVEFFGNWLDFRRFEELNSVDRARFPSFTNELRQAMFDEPIRFTLDVIQQDRSILDLLDATDTFANPTLARHYGFPIPDVAGQKSDADWFRVPDARDYGRGGMLTMSVFLTRNSPGLRTSPVKRGYWVVRKLLGEHIPAPPPDVPELPKDEAQSDLTLPQLLAKHREHQACAGCHQRFDSFGLAFEGFGPIGERREQDLAGRAIEDEVAFPDGTRGTGVEGLRAFLVQHRRDQFVDTFCHKLLAYALGRSLLLSDRATLNAMRQKLVENDYRFSALIETIVTSPQFRHKRGQAVSDATTERN